MRKHARTPQLIYYKYRNNLNKMFGHKILIVIKSQLYKICRYKT